jgi:putative phosphoesterase
MLRIGLISDTHGLLRPEALGALRGADHLIHGGDIGEPALLATLSAIAPVTAVRGNNDRAGWEHLATDALLLFEEVRVYVVHDANELRRRAPPPGVRVVVSGHSHQPSVRESDGLLWVNPGSAGPRRFRLPVSVGELLVEGDRVEARLVELRPAPVR